MKKLMHQVLDCQVKAGEIGIEVELEGNNLPMDGFDGWRAERDGSLRGQAVELVMKNPAKRHLVKRHLKKFESMVANSIIEDTGRAGIHVHVNIQTMTEQQLVSFMTLYVIFENALVEWCGKGRVGNLFCLRASDAEVGLRIIRAVAKRGDWFNLNTDKIRYSSMNAKAIATYGSLEFRAMRSTTNIQDIQQWVDMLLVLKDYAMEPLRTPQGIIESMSTMGVEHFFYDVYEEGKWPGLRFNYEDLVEGMRNAQTIAYARDWDAPVVKMPDHDVRFDVVGDEEEVIGGLAKRLGAEAIGRWLRLDEEGWWQARVPYDVEQEDWRWVSIEQLSRTATYLLTDRPVTSGKRSMVRGFLRNVKPIIDTNMLAVPVGHLDHPRLPRVLGQGRPGHGLKQRVNKMVFNPDDIKPIEDEF